VREVYFNHGVITVFTVQGAVHDFDFYDMMPIESRQFRLQTTQSDEEEAEILQYIRVDVQKAELVLTSNNVLMVCNEGKVHRLHLEQLLPKSKVVYNFVRMRYQEVRNRKKINSS